MSLARHKMEGTATDSCAATQQLAGMPQLMQQNSDSMSLLSHARVQQRNPIAVPGAIAAQLGMDHSSLSLCASSFLCSRRRCQFRPSVLRLPTAQPSENK